ASSHVAKTASARARVAHDHHGGVPLGPTLADIRACGFLAYRVKAVLAPDGPGLRKSAAYGRPDAYPVWFALNWGIRIARLFRMPQRAAVRLCLIEDGGHRKRDIGR